MQPNQNNAVKKATLALLAVLGVVLTIFVLLRIVRNRDAIFGSSALSVDVRNGPAEVYIDGEKVGTTPLESHKVKPGTHTLKIKKDSQEYESSLVFSPSSQVVVNRDLGVSNVFSAGQNFWLDSKDLSSKLSVVSEPSGASVYIDDVEVGKTPYSSSVLSDGEYDFKVEKEGYEPQTARIKVQSNMKLNVSTQLFKLPIPERPALMGGSRVVYDLSSDDNNLILDVSSWVSGINYYSSTRGGSVKFTYYVDYTGAIYDVNGKSVSTTELTPLKSGDTVGYLGRKSDPTVTPEAAVSLAKVTGSAVGGTRYKVSSPVGWLRVRSEPGLSGTEVGRLNTGDEVSSSEEKSGWVKVTLKDGKEGWASLDYLTEIK